MALPTDMQFVNIILLKSDVERIDQLANSLRQSRSEFLRNLITDGLVAFSLPDRLSEETSTTPKRHPEPADVPA